MRNLWLLPLLVVVTATAVASLENFDEFCAKYNKEYSSEEEREYRETIFRENLEDIVNHNKLHTKGLVTWYKKVHEYMDYTEDEFVEARMGLPPMNRHSMKDSTSLHEIDLSKVNLPEQFSWVDEGGVTSVKDQGQCGSCAAFSAIAAVETCFWQQTGVLYDDLSEQFLLDCAYQYSFTDDEGTWGTDGCNGAWPMAYYDWLAGPEAGWTQTEAAYPYLAASIGDCQYESSGFYSEAKVYGQFNKWDSYEDEMAALVLINPVVTSVLSTYWGSYGGGVYDDPNCCDQDTDPNCIYTLNHAVTVVGYGHESGLDYWLVKNSWGDWFGENGYIKVKRGTGHCGIGRSHITMPFCRKLDS